MSGRITPLTTIPQGADRDKREVAVLVNAMLDGRSNAGGSFTLAANTTTTTVTDPKFGPDTRLAWAPTTSNAASALSGLYVSAKAAGSFTLTHANNAQTDRTFDYVIQG